MDKLKKEILRPQWDSRKQMWKIVKKTLNGSHGWASFGDILYLEREDAASTIDWMVSKRPEMYEKDV